MQDSNLPSDQVLKQSVTDLKEPVLFKRMLQDSDGKYTWKLFEWNLLTLADKFGDTKLPFRVGYNARSMGPQWEINCSTIFMTLSEFIQSTDSNMDKEMWYYFDYKYMQEWFKDKPEIIASLDWNKFGFDKTGLDSTIWIGSKGAHTNCHQDSYGCNLVAQIHGRKQWLLFPPSSSTFLQPTRVPYEESTVYSKFNFFCPSEKDEISILKIPDKPKLITLNPGDVLLVPAGWWHYVESLDVSVSVNIWLPLETDSEARVREAIIKLIVERIGQKVCPTKDEDQCTLSDCMQLLNAAVKECESTENSKSPHKKLKLDAWTAEDLSKCYPANVKLIDEVEGTELKDILRNKRERFSENSSIESRDGSTDQAANASNVPSSVQQLSERVVNALCHPDVVHKVAELLLTS